MFEYNITICLPLEESVDAINYCQQKFIRKKFTNSIT